MNRKEWIEYFEAINNRKPTIQECQQALLNGEFVMEGKQATFSNNGKSVTEEVMPLPNQMTGQMVNPAYSQQMVFVKKKKFGKKTFIGLGIALFLVVATSLVLFLFSSKGTNLGGLWVNGNNAGLVYELSGKKSKLVAGHREEEIKEIYDQIKLPKRATRGSAGYDFFSPVDFELKPGETIKIPTGIRVFIESDWVLNIFPRSGLGFKFRLQMNNTVGIIDSDYFYSDNEGHIFAKLINDTNENKVVELKADTGFMQGIFVEYGITVDDDVTDVRNGGFGSTTK